MKLRDQMLSLFSTISVKKGKCAEPYQHYADCLGIKRKRVRELIRSLQEEGLIVCRKINVQGSARNQIKLTTSGRKKIDEAIKEV